MPIKPITVALTDGGGTRKKKEEDPTIEEIYQGYLSSIPTGVGSVGFNYNPTERPTYDSKWQPAVDRAAADYFSRGAYTPTWEDNIKALAESLNNRQPFKYDVNADELYHQYRAQYIKNGRLAMEDTMGKAQQMSGGYGNSYAQSVGQQTYNQYMDKVNNVIPELYSLAESRYNREGDQMRQNLAMYQNLEDNAYARYRNDTQDAYNRLNAANALENNEYSRYRNDVSDWQNAENLRFKTAQEQLSAAQSNQQMQYKLQQAAIDNAADMALQLIAKKDGATKEEVKAAADNFNKMTPAQVVDTLTGFKAKASSGEMTDAEARSAAQAMIELYGNDKTEESGTYNVLMSAYNRIFGEEESVDTSNPASAKNKALEKIREQFKRLVTPTSW